MGVGKNFIGKKQIVSAGDMSQASVTSTIINIQGLDNIGIQVNITSGTATGTFDIKISADHTQDPSGGALVAGSFTKLGGSYTAALTSGVFADGTATCFFDINGISAPYLELVYTKTSGTGTFDAFATGKAI